MKSMLKITCLSAAASDSPYANLGAGWSVSGGSGANYKATWTGNASTVKVFDDTSIFGFFNPEVYCILFLVQ